TASSRRAMNGGNGWNFQCRQPIENMLTPGDKGAQLAAACLLQQRLQIGARYEDRFFGGGKNQAAQGGILFNKVELFVQLLERSGVENIRGRSGPIECQHADLVPGDFAPNHWI